MPQSNGVVKAWPLIAAAAALELLALCGVVPSDPGIVHGVALPPLDITYDMTLLLSRATSPLWFAFGLVLSITGRAVILSLMLGSIRRWWFALRFELLCLVPAYLSAEASYAGRAMLYAAVYWVGIALGIASALFLSHAPWEDPKTLRQALKLGFTRGPRAPTVALYVAGLAALGGVIHGDGSPFALTAVVVSLALTIVTARRLRTWPATPIASRTAAVILAALLVGLLVAPSGQTTSGVTSARRSGELFVVAGIDTSSGHGSMYSLRPSLLGYDCKQTYYFSYLGAGNGTSRGQSTCPIVSGARYSRADTERPLAVLVSAFNEEVDALRPPVTVVTHSSGAWVAWAALSSDPASPVDALVMLSPLTDPAGYPAPGRDGSAVVGAAGMRLLAAIGKEVGFSRFDPDRPLARELLGSKDATSTLFRRAPAQQLRSLAIPTAFDLALFYDSAGGAFPHSVEGCALIAGHSATPTSSAALDQAEDFLTGRRDSRCGPEADWIASSGAAFGTP